MWYTADVTKPKENQTMSQGTGNYDIQRAPTLWEFLGEFTNVAHSSCIFPVIPSDLSFRFLLDGSFFEFCIGRFIKIRLREIQFMLTSDKESGHFTDIRLHCKVSIEVWNSTIRRMIHYCFRVATLSIFCIVEKWYTAEKQIKKFLLLRLDGIHNYGNTTLC